MKKYKFKFSKLMIILFILGSLLGVTLIALNFIKLVKTVNNNVDAGPYGYLSIILVILLSLLFIVLALSAMISSYYRVEKNKVVLKWGLIKNVVELNDVKEIKYLVDKNKLVLIFKDDSYFNILTETTWFDDFIKEVKEQAKNAVYIQESSGENAD